MTIVYRTPESLGDPPDFSDFMKDGNYDYKAHSIAENEWIETVREAARKANPTCKIAGGIVSFPVADGGAMYVVWNNRSMVHLPVGDAYSIPDAHARGLRAADLKALADMKPLTSAFA